MRKFLFILSMSMLTGSVSARAYTDSISVQLEHTFSKKEYYTDQKKKKIVNLKQLLGMQELALEQRYEVCINLQDMYRKYALDSAIVYTEHSLDVAKVLNKQKWIDQSSLILAGLYSTAGMYVESLEILGDIKKTKLDKALIPLYYDAYSEFYGHYAQSNDRHIYYKKNEAYRDSMLMVLDTASLKYKIVSTEKIFFKGQVTESQDYLLDLLDKTSDEIPERAHIAYLLGLAYQHQGNVVQQRKYYTISAITDIKNAIKDNASLQSLALTYFETGDIELAYKYMESAIDDAVFCNVRFRTIESSSFYTSINNTYLDKRAKQERELRDYLIFISMLTVLLVATLIYVYKQMKRLSKIRKELYRTNTKLQTLNEDMNSSNSKLHDSNLIKEEYIAHFFDLCSEYINKLEEYRKSLNKLAAAKKMEDLFKALKSTSSIDLELENLYSRFDSIFLSLYPNFVDEFNNLLVEEERITLKQGELLNTELRIFALIRLGITDSVRIAAFLRYSLSTIYNYRTKARNKASVPRDEFEDRVTNIGASNSQ